MTGTGHNAPLSAAEILARYGGLDCYDPDTGQVDGSAFVRKAKDIDGLSVTRRSFFSQDVDEDRQEIRRVVGARVKLARHGRFFEVGVGAILNALAEFGQAIDVVEDPLAATALWPANDAHALIRELPFKDMTIGSLTWQVAGDRIAGLVRDHFPARDPAG